MLSELARRAEWGPVMAWWYVGDEEADDERFRAVPGGLGLYVGAGSHCLRQIRYRPEAEIPPEWFIPDHWIKGWPNGSRIANALAREGLFVKMYGGFGFAWIREQNTADAVRRQRKRDREKKAGGKPR